MPTTQAYRDATARLLGGYEQFGVEAGSTASQVVIASAFKSSVLKSDALGTAWVYNPVGSAPRERRVAKDGLNGSTGVITLEDALGSSVATGATIEIHTVLPAGNNADTIISINACVLEAHKYLMVHRVVSLDVIDDEHDYPLTAWPALNRPGRLLAVRVPNARNTTTLTLDPKRYEFRQAGTSNTLHFHSPFRLGHGSFSISLELYVPSSTFINGATSSTGLQLETDTAVPETRDVAAVALLFAYGALAQSEDGARATHYARLLPAQIEQARKAYGYDQEADIAARFAPLAQGAVPQGATAEAA